MVFMKVTTQKAGYILQLLLDCFMVHTQKETSCMHFQAYYPFRENSASS